jgi:hypothetical protein
MAVRPSATPTQRPVSRQCGPATSLASAGVSPESTNTSMAAARPGMTPAGRAAARATTPRAANTTASSSRSLRARRCFSHGSAAEAAASTDRAALRAEAATEGPSGKAEAAASAASCACRSASPTVGGRPGSPASAARSAGRPSRMSPLLARNAVGAGEEMERPGVRAVLAPDAHALARVAGAGPLADLGEGRARGGVAPGRLHPERGGRRGLLVVVGRAGARPGREIELGPPPGFQAGGDLGGEASGIAGQPEGRQGGAGHGAVVAVLAADVEEGRQDDVRPLGPESADQLLDDALLAPARERVVAGFGEAEIVHRVVRPEAKPGDRGVERARRRLHLAGAQGHERAAPLRADGVLPALAAGRAGDDDAKAVAKAQGRQEAAVLVVRMGPGVHHGEDAAEAA